MTVVAVRPRRGHWLAVVGDDGTELLIDKRTWEESPYGVGSFLSLEDREALRQRSEEDRAREKAVFLLSRRDYSRRELEQKLCREKGRYHAERRDSAAAAVEEMAACGYVDDTRYATRLAREYCLTRLYPRRRAVEKLCEKGIDRETARRAVEAVETDDTQLALEFLRKKRYNIPQTREAAEKIAAAMGRYGFSGEDIRRALSLWQEEETHVD